MMLESCYNLLEKDLEQMSVNTVHNQHHLIEYMKYTEYLKDKEDRISLAWIDSNIRRVEEYKEVQKLLPPGSRKRPCKGTSSVEPTKLSLKACPSKTYLEAPRTEQLEEALEYISRMHRTDAELQEMDAITSPPPS
jgi:hypothetical protein